jgi:hypothetical protein
MLKLVAGGCSLLGAFCIVGLLPVTFWLLHDTGRDPKTLGMRNRLQAVPAAAVRGEWPDLPSARWYRRLVRVLLTAWICGVITLTLHEVTH